ncbi:MAG: ribose-phosphate diphosphokinase [Firmicutes bacterium]|nr:ribose-phosphate diphosphokinase [Bacillota bacterium]
MKFFAGSASRHLAAKIGRALGIRLGASETMRFSEGNTFVRVNEPVRGYDVYVLQTIGRDPNNEFMELLFWVDAFKRASANSVTAIMPYFSYAKGDKKDEPRVSIRARVCADALEAAGVDRVVTMDLHSPQIQGFFRVPVDHLYALPVLCRHIERSGGDLVVVSPDAGFAKRARTYARRLGASVAIGDKMRSGHDECAVVEEIIGEVEGKDALIVDDFTTTCGSLIEAARAVLERGARSVRACVSHCLLDERGLSALEASPLAELLVTDTVENPLAASAPKIRIASVAGLFAEAIGRIQRRESLSVLFDE